MYWQYIRLPVDIYFNACHLLIHIMALIFFDISFYLYCIWQQGKTPCLIHIMVCRFFKLSPAFMIHRITYDSKHYFLLQSSFSIHDYFGLKCKCLSSKHGDSFEKVKSTHKKKIDLCICLTGLWIRIIFLL